MKNEKLNNFSMSRFTKHRNKRKTMTKHTGFIVIMLATLTILLVGAFAGTMITDRATKVIPEAKVIETLDDVTVENYEDKVIEKGVLATEHETLMKIRIAFGKEVNKCVNSKSYLQMEECSNVLKEVNARYETPIKNE
jgi:hypothetical protein